MATKQDLDFSTTKAPESWFEAAAEAPQGPRRMLRHSGITIMPVGHAFDLFSACLLALTAGGLFGVAWYVADISEVLVSPWPALGLGAILALVIRFGAGRHERETRAALAAAFYLLTLAVVVLLQARHAYVGIYGSAGSFSVFEHELLHTRLSDPWNITAWLGGLLLTMKLSLMLGFKH